jgi:hypothetical protein
MPGPPAGPRPEIFKLNKISGPKSISGWREPKDAFFKKQACKNGGQNNFRITIAARPGIFVWLM